MAGGDDVGVFGVGLRGDGEAIKSLGKRGTNGQGEGVIASVAWLFGEQSWAVVLSGEAGGGSGDRKWTGGGGV